MARPAASPPVKPNLKPQTDPNPAKPAAKSAPKPKPPPSRLAHYTTLDGLMGIVRSGKIWASNVSFLNDNRELRHGIDASVAAIKILSKKPKAEHWVEPLKAAAAKLLADKIPNTYAACFCETTDSLSQWRGYGGAVQGVALIFRRQPLVTLMAGQKARLHRVIYCDMSAPKRMREAVERQLGSLDEINDLLGATTPTALRRDAYAALCRLIPQFKHWGFRDEDEWRFVVQQPKLTDAVRFRSNGNLIVPYVELGSDEPSALPLVEVMVGPGRHPALTAQSLRQFLDRNGYSEVEITISKVPFRT